MEIMEISVEISMEIIALAKVSTFFLDNENLMCSII